MARRAPSMVVLSAALAESNLARAALSVMIWVLRLWDLSLAEMIVVFPLSNMLWSQLLAPAGTKKGGNIVVNLGVFRRTLYPLAILHSLDLGRKVSKFTFGILGVTWYKISPG